MVNLTRIYTRIGDEGRTNLADMSFTSKTDPRVRAYGECDEANSVLGIALATGGLPPRIEEILRHVQNELFDVGADLSTPVVEKPRWEPLRILPAAVERLEAWCDEFTAQVPALRSFILPGGTLAAAHLHLARTVVRRAERSAWEAAAQFGTEPGTGEESSDAGINPVAITYLNRLSDLLFIMTRIVNGATGDVLWVPGGERGNLAYTPPDGVEGEDGRP